MGVLNPRDLSYIVNPLFLTAFYKETKMKHLTASFLSLFLLPALVGAHCEIPCGIYGDEGRFALLLENVTTIEKSMNEINTLSGESEKNNNQIVRWVVNKEHHADHIRDIVAQYFLAQRIKEPAEGDATAAKAYTEKLIALHKIIRTAMVCKQTTDPKNAQTLRDHINAFQALYNAK